MFNRLTFYTFLMLLVPLAAWLSGWYWAGDDYLISALDYPLWLITETGSAPYALVPCVLLMLWLMRLARKRYSWLLVGAICAGSVIGTQAIKTVAKFGFAEPRPYVVAMMNDQTEQFYELSRDQRAELVYMHYEGSDHPIIVEHRANETGYSFPSGHTIFAVSWLLVFAGLLVGTQGRAANIALGVMTIWAMLMLISRLRLGMHYPIDLFVSTLIAWVFHVVLFIWIVPKVEQWKLFRRA